MLERIADMIGLSEGEVRKRISYVNLTEEDICLLKELSEKLGEEDITELFREFYAHLLSFEDTRRILGKEKGLIERLKRAQSRYFRELLEADYTTEYVISRLRVGEVHERLGVEPKHYTGAFARWVESVIPVLKEKVHDDKVVPTILALFKAVILDITFSLEAYLYSKLMRSAASRYRAILDSIREAILVADSRTGRVEDLNHAALDLLGLDEKEEVIGRDVLWIHPRELRPVVGRKLRRQVEEWSEVSEVSYVENKRSGEWIPVEISYGAFEEEGRKFIVGVLRKVREKLRREEIIDRINKLYGTLSKVSILTTTVSSIEDILPLGMRILREGGFRYAGAFMKGEDEPLAEEGLFSEKDASVCIPMEEDLYLLVSRWSEEGFTKEEIELLREVAHDLSFALRNISMEERLSRLELYDELTQLPNRIHFFRKLSEVIERFRRGGKEVGLFLIGVDNFSELSAAFGHDSVDDLLMKIAGRLREQIGAQGFVGRVGVDEFGVILISRNVKNTLDRLISTIKEAFREPFMIGSHEIYVTLSIGISVFPEDVDTEEGLFSNASYSLQKARDTGGNRAVYYSRTTERAVLERVRLRTDLRRAARKGEFVLFYQPKVDLRTQKVVGAEALLRWKKEGDLVSPVKFIPVLEESGLIHEVGGWVIEEACRQMRSWRARGIMLPVAVNVSPIQLRNPGFLEDFFRAVSSCEEGCSGLEVEITESGVMEDINRIIDILRAMNSAGIKVYIDDFGTGYSSLAYLKKLPVYALKIDTDFIRDLPEDRDDLEIVKATVKLARAFGLRTVAEGVERREQVRVLEDLGCDFGQGYYFGKPVPADEFERAVLGLRRGFS